MSPDGLPRPQPDLCLTTSRKSTYKGGTLIEETVWTLEEQNKRVANGGYRPEACLTCGCPKVHVHDYLERHPLAKRKSGWDGTQVNELLVQMESVGGVFICATNLLETFDLAVARRFALQIRFDPLTVDGAFRMLSSMVAGFGKRLLGPIVRPWDGLRD
jgi:hypothetical protein